MIPDMARVRISILILSALISFGTVPSAFCDENDLTLQGELIKDDTESGVWSLRTAPDSEPGAQVYDLHGKIELEDGDWVRVTGAPNPKLNCYHMKGAVLTVASIEKIDAPAVPGGWTRFERTIICADAFGKPIKILKRGRRTGLLNAYDDLHDNGHYKMGDVLSDSRHAWAIFSDHQFRYFDTDGRALWTKPQIAHAVFSSGPANVLLAVRDPGCPARKAIEDCDLYAVLLSTAGQTLMDFKEAPLLHREAIYLTESGRYGYAKMARPVDGTLFFDVQTQKKKVYSGLGLPKIDDTGVYRILGKTSESSAVREIYSGTLAGE